MTTSPAMAFVVLSTALRFSASTDLLKLDPEKGGAQEVVLVTRSACGTHETGEGHPVTSGGRFLTEPTVTAQTTAGGA